MGTYRSRNFLAGPLSPEEIAAVELPLAALGRRGYRRGDVDALVQRLAYELAAQNRELDQLRAENQRIKRALRTWQAERSGGAGSRGTSGRHRRITNRRVSRAEARRRPDE